MGVERCVLIRRGAVRRSLLFTAGETFTIGNLVGCMRLIYKKSVSVRIEINLRIVREQTSACHILAGGVDFYLTEFGVKRNESGVSCMMKSSIS